MTRLQDQLRRFALASAVLGLLVGAAGHASGDNLIVNGDFSDGNVGFTSPYLYSPVLSNQGDYCVGADPTQAHPAFSSFGDHTTGTGLMLMANGAVIADTVVWQETVPVAVGTTYLFTGWSASMGYWGGTPDPSPAVLQFSINDVQIGSDFSPLAQAGQWTQFSALWTANTDMYATIIIIDNNTEWNGNDFGLDDLSFIAVPAAIPEPSAIAMIATGLPLGLGIWCWKRRRAA